MTQDEAKPLLEVRDLRVYFGDPARPARAVDGVSFAIRPGETVALVGESGCGKSVTAFALARLNPEPPSWVAGGSILWRGRDVLGMDGRALRRLRGGEIAFVFQEPAQALNPVFTVGGQIGEALALHRPEAAGAAEVRRWLERVGMTEPDRVAAAYPHQLSGGMQQRAVIAMALACRPGLLVADEPTTALDVTLQAQIMARLAELQAEFGMAILLIAHNLALVAGAAERVNVMYAGRIVESGPTAAVLERPAHPYTRSLLAAVPRLDAPRNGRAPALRGQVPAPTDWPDGCRFHPRCPLSRKIKDSEPTIGGAVGPEGARVCRERVPVLEEVGPGHVAACSFWRRA